MLLVFVLLAVGRAGAEDAEAPSSESIGNDYVGDAACLTCHEALHNGFTAKYQQTIHANIFTY